MNEESNKKRKRVLNVFWISRTKSNEIYYLFNSKMNYWTLNFFNQIFNCKYLVELFFKLVLNCSMLKPNIILWKPEIDKKMLLRSIKTHYSTISWLPFIETKRKIFLLWKKVIYNKIKNHLKLCSFTSYYFFLLVYILIVTIILSS